MSREKIIEALQKAGVEPVNDPEQTEAIFTSRVLELSKKLKDVGSGLPNVEPLDYDDYTRFLFTGKTFGGLAPNVYFDNVNWVMTFSNGFSDGNNGGGFRPASRT